MTGMDHLRPHPSCRRRTHALPFSHLLAGSPYSPGLLPLSFKKLVISLLALFCMLFHLFLRICHLFLLSSIFHHSLVSHHIPGLIPHGDQLLPKPGIYVSISSIKIWNERKMNCSSSFRYNSRGLALLAQSQKTLLGCLIFLNLLLRPLIRNNYSCKNSQAKAKFKSSFSRPSLIVTTIADRIHGKHFLGCRVSTVTAKEFPHFFLLNYLRNILSPFTRCFLSSMNPGF